MSPGLPERNSALPLLSSHTVRALRVAVVPFAEHTAERIQHHVLAYAGPREGRRRQLIEMAINAAARIFLETLGPQTPVRTGVHDLFRRMGYGEASEGNDLGSLDAALRIGHLEAIDFVQDATDRGDIPLAALTTVAGELSRFIDELAREAHTGSSLFLAAQLNDPTAIRRALLAALIAGDEEEIAPLAEQVGWEVPRRMVLMVVEAPLEMVWPAEDEFPPALVDTNCTPALVLVNAADADDVQTRLRALDPAVTIARCWPVTLSDVRNARRWAQRALRLMTTGAIPRQPVVDCSRYYTQLWLHAEPGLRSQLVQTHLSPLLAETANSREILSSTLLIWLRTRESAPAIASLLGVHPQTVRYRWRKLNELFGDAFLDPTRLIQMMLTLEATAPLWTAGDQSDLIRYRAERGLDDAE